MPLSLLRWTLLLLVSNDLCYPDLYRALGTYLSLASRVITEPVLPTEETKAMETGDMTTDATEAPVTTNPPEAAPKPTKRGSVFGNFFNKKDGMSPSREKKEKDMAPAVPVKDAEATPMAATEEPASVTQLEETAVMSTPAENTIATSAAPTATTAHTPASESKGGIFGFLKQKEAQREVRNDHLA